MSTPAPPPHLPPVPVDPNRASAARIYDALLGGTHNFASDRAVVARTLELIPDMATITRANRVFLRRAVRWAVSRGIRQFLDLGSGIPTEQNVHEIAPEARVVYVDVDPTAVLYARHLLGDDPRVTVLAGDLRDPSALLAAAPLDFSQPVGFLMVAVLHFIPDGPALTDALRAYRDIAAPGSVLVVAHATSDDRTAELERVADIFNRTGSSLLPRDIPQVTRFFDGWDLVPPGVVPQPLWHPDPDAPAPDPSTFLMLAGAAVRPWPSSSPPAG